MYSPTSRLLTVLEMLQSYKNMSGSEMARRLEVDVRTVRRYIVTLQDMGIPVESERGPYGAYQLARGFKLPPLMFTDAEAVALTLGLIAIRQLKFPVNVAAVEGALAKTERVMPEKLLNQVRGLQAAILFNVTPPPAIPDNDSIVTLSLAVQQRQQVHMKYESWQGDASARDFSPYGIVFNEGFWYTAGYCHLRQGIRTFRLDRVLSVDLLDKASVPPADFDIMAHVLRSIGSPSGENQIEVLLKTSLERAQQLFSPIMGTLEEVDDGVMLRRSASEFEYISHILLRADFPVVVRQPAQLRQMIREMSARALQILSESDEA